MKKTLALLLALVLLAALSACGKKTPAPAGDETTVPVENETEAPTDEETEAPEPETVARPTADGQAVEAYDLSFYLPEGLTANEYNGMLGFYEFYTGEFAGSKPSGMDFSLLATAESNAKGDLEAYAREAGAGRNRMTAEPETETINGTDWLVFREDGKVNFFAIFNNGLYEIYAERGGDTEENFSAALSMLEETLFLAVNPD